MLANKNSLIVDQGGFAADAIANNVHQTGAFAGSIGPLAYLAYKVAKLRLKVATDAVGVVRLVAGAETLATVDYSSDTEAAVEVDLAAVQGQTALAIEVDVTTAGTGTGQVFAVLDVEQPGIMNKC